MEVGGSPVRRLLYFSLDCASGLPVDLITRSSIERTTQTVGMLLALERRRERRTLKLLSSSRRAKLPRIAEESYVK